jgi:hypothetical protein
LGLKVNATRPNQRRVRVYVLFGAGIGAGAPPAQTTIEDRRGRAIQTEDKRKKRLHLLRAPAEFAKLGESRKAALRLRAASLGQIKARRSTKRGHG